VAASELKIDSEKGNKKLTSKERISAKPIDASMGVLYSPYEFL